MTLTATFTDTKYRADGGMNGPSSKAHRKQQDEFTLNTVWDQNTKSKVQFRIRKVYISDCTKG